MDFAYINLLIKKENTVTSFRLVKLVLNLDLQILFR